MAEGPPVVAIINSSPDTVDLLRHVLEQAGFVVVSSQAYEIRGGHVDLQQLVQVHEPRVIVYDISPPYDRNWRFFEHIRQSPLLRGCRFVVTSTNPERLREMVHPQETVYEIIGKPFDLGLIVRAVQDAAL
jgi:CheY-like chemotaxis protein